MLEKKTKRLEITATQKIIIKINQLVNSFNFLSIRVLLAAAFF